jgi:L-alanine-DL-glutamate epimerase-like enolase superfamily enzyme
MSDLQPSSAATMIDATAESWPIAGRFVISRGAKTEAVVVVATVGDGRHTGRGEAVPYARYGETVEAVLAQIRSATTPLTRADLGRAMPAGAARNALDCALWDLEAKAAGLPVAELAGLMPPGPVTTCYTLSLDTPDAMAARAHAVAHLPLLKLKLGGEGDAERMAAVRAARPDARLVADANEAWTADQLQPLLAAAAASRFELIEQPLPADNDAVLAHVPHPLPVCADESAHTRADLARIAGRYEAVNIKLDKAGGLTEALAMVAAARDHGLDVMVGCMVATSLAMAPAFLLAQGARWADLDGPLLLARDRDNGLLVRHGVVEPPGSALWG